MQIIYTELKNTLEYVCSINVFDTQMLMRVSYNSRSKKRIISLTSLDESILFLKPTYITEGSRVFPNINAKLNGLSFYITLNPLSFSGENYKDWANQYQLCFVEYTPYTNLTTDRFYVNKSSGNDSQGSDDEDTSVTPSFGDWVVTKVEIVNQDIKYFSEKTNTIDTYDSYAVYPLEQALVNSFHDVDMQQWQGFVDAVNTITNNSEWVYDTETKTIKYIDQSTIPLSAYPLVYHRDGRYFSDPYEMCEYVASSLNTVFANVIIHRYRIGGGKLEERPFEGFNNLNNSVCRFKSGSYSGASVVSNPTYDPNIVITPVTVEMVVVAEKIISNLQSSNEGTSLLAEAYIEAVVNSIFNQTSSKQFVNLDELKTQLESNKTLRS